MSLTVRFSRAPTRFGSLLSLLMLLSVALALLFAVSARADESAAAEFESDGDSGELDTDATTVEFDALPGAAAAGAAAAADEDDEDFSNYRRTHNKNYRDNNEATYRRNIYHQNKDRVSQLNGRDANAEFTVRSSPFSDYTPEEFRERFLMHNADIDDAPAEPRDARRHARAQTVRNAGPIPTSFDWRSRAAVTPVKNQGRCGSCWAYSVADQVESQWFLAGNPLLRLSAQQFVDCDRTNYGCAGGWPGNTYNYLISAGGEALESTYPYSSANSAVAGSCKYKPAMSKARISSWVFTSKAGAVNETRMMEELYRYGPLSVCLAAADWQFYRGGVFTSTCSTVLDHCVQLIGYGVTNTGVKYWTIKNQWGTGWGESGYMRLQRGTNKCAIGAYATRAIV